MSNTPGAPPFTALILDKIWVCVESSPLLCLDWLTQQVPRSAEVSLWMQQQTYNLDLVEEWLLGHSSARVRMHFAILLASLVPNPFFRQIFRSKAVPLSIAQLQSGHQEAVQKLFKLLLYLIERAHKYVKHGSDGLVAYFNLMTTCLVSKSEKLMVRPVCLYCVAGRFQLCTCRFGNTSLISGASFKICRPLKCPSTLANRLVGVG